MLCRTSHKRSLVANASGRSYPHSELFVNIHGKYGILIGTEPLAIKNLAERSTRHATEAELIDKAEGDRDKPRSWRFAVGKASERVER